MLFPRVLEGASNSHAGSSLPSLIVALKNSSSNEDSELHRWSSFIGIATAIVGNILISFALNIQRYAHIKLGRELEERNKSWKHGRRRRYSPENYGSMDGNADGSQPQSSQSPHTFPYRDEPGTDGLAVSSSPSRSSGPRLHEARSSEKLDRDLPRKSYLKSPYWWAGIILMIVGEAGNFLAYGFAPASIVSPLGVVALVSNCIIAPCLLKERFRKQDFWGVMIAVGGAVTVVLSAKHEEQKLGPGDVWHAITRWEFETYLGITVAMIVVLMWASGRYGERTILIDLGLVGLFGGYTALSTKGVASLLSYTFWHVLTFPVSYLLVAILISTALLQIRYLNRALQRFNSTQVIPTQFVLFTISVIIGSSILYRDFESATSSRVGKFIGGCALTFLGVYLITSGRVHEASDEGHESDEEETIGLAHERPYRDDVDIDEEENRQPPRKSSVVANDQDNAPSPTQMPRSATGPDSVALSHAPSTSGGGSPRRRDLSPHASFDDTLEVQSSLLDNPWRSPSELLAPPTPHRFFQSTQSSPNLPIAPTDSNARPVTPTDSGAGNDKPFESPNVQRPKRLSRHSISRMMPAPLSSPLSSSLSAVVADNLRRGVDNSPSKRRTSKARPESSAATLSRASSRQNTNFPQSGGENDQEISAGPDESNLQAMARTRSLSSTLTDILRKKRGRRDSQVIEG